MQFSLCQIHSIHFRPVHLFDSRPGHGVKAQSDDIQRVGFFYTLFLSQNCPNDREIGKRLRGYVLTFD